MNEDAKTDEVTTLSGARARGRTVEEPDRRVLGGFTRRLQRVRMASDGDGATGYVVRGRVFHL